MRYVPMPPELTDELQRFTPKPANNVHCAAVAERCGLKIPRLGEAAIETLGRVDHLFSSASVIETANDVKLRAAQRAIDRKAPFHRQRNSIDDAILIETYADLVNTRNPGDRFSFVTHNTKDFSHPNANEKLPHPDIAACFSRITAFGERIKTEISITSCP